MAIFIRFFANILGLYLANLWVSGFSIIDGWQAYLVAGIVLGLLNLIIRPILKIITFPLIMVSLGLFLIVINAIILWLTAQLTGYVVIENYIALLWATIVIAAVNFIAHWFK
ncbi:MAG: phage holin family protein [Candidatus Yanofskybacteria bacterium]|nr:phage holin family protein [Candidatus Yanofskybacteria bacterium]